MWSKLISVEQDEKGVKVTYERGDGTHYSFYTCIPGKYGIKDKVLHPVTRMMQDLEALKERCKPHGPNQKYVDRYLKNIENAKMIFGDPDV